MFSKICGKAVIVLTRHRQSIAAGPIFKLIFIFDSAFAPNYGLFFIP